LKYYENENTCKLDDSIPTVQNRKERKELYEYCIDYKTILEKYNPCKDKCNKYCAYVEKKIPLFEKYQTFCSASDKSNCPDFYENCKNYDPKVLLKQLKCKDEMEKEKAQLKDAPVTNLSGTTSISFPSIESLSEYGNVFLGVVVTSMTSGFLYKFTPIGRQIRSGFLGNNNNISNLNTNADELFVQESYSPYAGEEQHYIGYHAS
ncbi:Plasmodium vivax Vir protein, putative, partial [Plasmodium vivax]